MCHLKKTMDAGLPNERAIGITVGTDICASFSKTGWLAIALLIQPSSPASGKDS